MRPSIEDLKPLYLILRLLGLSLTVYAVWVSPTAPTSDAVTIAWTVLAGAFLPFAAFGAARATRDYLLEHRTSKDAAAEAAARGTAIRHLTSSFILLGFVVVGVLVLVSPSYSRWLIKLTIGLLFAGPLGLGSNALVLLADRSRILDAIANEPPKAAKRKPTKKGGK